MSPDPGLLREISAIGARIAKELQASSTRAVAASRLRATATLLMVAPAGALVAAGLARVLEAAFVVDPWWLLVLGLLPTLVLTLLAMIAIALTPARVEDGLARVDRDLRLEGRLEAAHEFLGRENASAFERAAIEDAGVHLPRARAHVITRARTEWPLLRVGLCLLGAVALSVLAMIVAPGSSTGVGTASGEPSGATAGTSDPQQSESTPRERAPIAAAKTPPKPAREPGAEAKTAAAKASPSYESKARESEGKTGEGVSANATPTNASSDSRGFTSSQTPPSDKTEKTAAKPKKPKAGKKERDVASLKKKLETSGATAGKGTGTGSSKNPGSTEWESKDQTTSDEEEPLAEDEEVNDEDDESEARGGLQPSLRDRRPATNRDLLIGFGNQPNPDANGRGGPSEQKKSRGVASLVLGVPIPDHVKGQPNPGRTKITQERVLPEPDAAANIAAEARLPRSAPARSRAEQDLPAQPWLHSLVKNYFLALRAQGAASESTAAKEKSP